MRFVVVGGGITGLAAALRLRDAVGAAAEIVVAEGSSRLGGKLHTGRLAAMAVEAGAEAFLTRDHGAESAAVALAERVGLADDLVHPAPVPAAIAVDRSLIPIPSGTLLGVPVDPSTVDSVAKGTDTDIDAGRPLLAPGQDVSVGELVRSRFGDEILDRLVEPMLGGVYAGRADQLSLAATMPGLHAQAQHHPTLGRAVAAALAGSPRSSGQPVFAGVRGGLSRLVAAVADAAGAEIRLNSPVREIRPTGNRWRLVLGSTRERRLLDADAVVLTVPAAPAARLLRGVELAAAAAVGLLEYAGVALVTLALPPETALPPLSGFLVPPGSGYTVKAATFVTVKWPHLRVVGSEPVLVRASLGRHGEERELQRTDAELCRLVQAELDALLAPVMPGGLPPPVAAAVRRWGGALPQYGVGHAARVGAVRAVLPPTLGLAGAAYDGVGIAACVRSGQAAADAVCGALRALKQLPT